MVKDIQNLISPFSQHDDFLQIILITFFYICQIKKVTNAAILDQKLFDIQNVI